MARTRSVLAAVVLLTPGLAWAGPPELPAFDLEPSVEVASTPAPRPPRGSTMFGFGVFGVTFGIMNVALGAWLIPFDPGDAAVMGVIPLAFGAGFTALGGVGIHYGQKRRRAYRDWQLAHGEVPNWIDEAHYPDAPPMGLGLLISGSVGISMACTVLPHGIPLLDSSTPKYRNEGIGYMALSAAGLATGVPMLIIGSVRLHRRNRWHAGLRATSLVPTPWLTPTGAGVGVVGRF